MMKKITLLFLLVLGVTTSWAQQVIFEEPFTNFTALGEAPPTGWVTLDEDGQAVNAFYTDQGAFVNGNWEHMNFGDPFSPGIYSCSNVEPLTGAVSNWLISPAIQLLVNPSLSIEVVSLMSSTVEVRYATTLAGATPVASDFTNVLTTFTSTQAYTLKSLALPTLSNQTVYIAFVDNNTAKDILGMRNFKVYETNDSDIKLSAITLGGATSYTTDYLAVNLDYANFSCDGPAAAAVTIEVTNVGVNPITTFDAYYVVDSFGMGAPTAMETVTLGTPLASGATASYTFTTTADLSSGDPFFSIDAWAVLTGDASNLDDTSSLALVFTPTAYDFANGPFLEGFEQVDFGAGQLSLASAAWLWTIIDANNDGYTFNISAANLGSPYSGDFTLGYEYNPNGTTPANDYAFSPCLDLQTGVGYQVSIAAACGEDNAGLYPEKFRLVYNTSASASGTTAIGAYDVNSADYTQFSGSFTVPATGSYHLGIHAQSTANQWYLNLDDLEIKTFTAAPISAFNVTQFDEVIGGEYYNYCNGNVTISNTSTGVADATTVNWGDGNVENFTGGSLSHTYAVEGDYTITVTASNVLGGTPVSKTFHYTSPPAPVANFTVGQAGVTDVSVDFNSIGTSYPCFTYDWIYGDGTIGTGAASSHTYTASGTYEVFLTVTSPTGQSSTVSKEVTVQLGGTAINEIDFVNGINVSPNPATDVLNIAFELNSNQDVEITLVSIDGKVVNATTSNNVSNVSTSINTTKLSTGMYILNVTTNEGKYTKNVMIK